MTRTAKRTGSTTPPKQGEKWTAARRAAYEKRRREGRPTKPWIPIHPDDEPFFTVSHAAREAMHSYLDSLESVLVMIAQRDMEPDQVDRLAAILQRAECSLLARLKSGSRSRTAATAAGSSTRSTAAGRAPRKAA